jgi:hypothetical protein
MSSMSYVARQSWCTTVLPVEDVYRGDAHALHQSTTAATEIDQPETEEISA